MNRSACLWLALALVTLVACNSNDGKGGSGSSGDLCQPDLGFPYGHNTYASNHSDAGNSDFIPCDGPASYAFDYHVLQGHVHAQPNTYSPDGQVTYATTTPGGDGCSVHAIRVATGEILWQRCGDFTAAIVDRTNSQGAAESAPRATSTSMSSWAERLESCIPPATDRVEEPSEATCAPRTLPATLSETLPYAFTVPENVLPISPSTVRLI